METDAKKKWLKIGRGIYRKPDGRYQVRYRPNGAVPFCTTVDTIKEAETIRNAHIEEVRHEENPELLKEKNPFFAEYAPMFANEYAIPKNPVTYNRVTKYTILRLISCFGAKKLKEITSLDVDRHCSYLAAKNIGAKTINREVAVLRKMLNTAVRWKLIKAHNVGKITKQEETDGRLVFLSKEEYARLFAAANDKLKDVLSFSMATGLRPSNIRKIEISRDVDYTTKKIRLRGVKGWGKRIKEIPMNTLAEAVLLRQTSDKPFNYDWSGPFAHAVIQAGLPSQGELKIIPYTLRHTFASWYVMNGGSIFDLQKLLLHKKIESTMVYAKLAPSYLQESSERMARLVSESLQNIPLSI